MAEDRRRVALIITGGTIDSVGTDRLDLGWYLEAGKRLGDGELLARVPELERIAEVTEIPFRRLPSQSITTADWLDLVKTIQDLFSGDRFDGVVITHGTNTLEETAYFLHLVLKTDRPVVLVGAMRPSSGVSADGDLNLINAVRVAADPAARGAGVLVVLNDTILGARDVTKTATYRVETFQGRDLGPLGYADSDGRVVFYRAPTRRHTARSAFDVRRIDRLPRVDISYSYVGDDGAMIDAAVANGAEGIVTAGTGGGMVSAPVREALLRARQRGVVVVLSSRVGSGRVSRTTRARERGFVAADTLIPQKARILLSLGLTQTRDPDELQRFFDAY